MSTLAWAATYADGRVITGELPENLPGAGVPRDGLVRFVLSQDNLPILAVDLGAHERLVFKRRMQVNPMAQALGAAAVALIIGSYDTRTDSVSALYLNGDGTMSLRVAACDVRPEPHEVG